MSYNVQLADRVREYLASLPGLEIEEKRMFSGLAFMVNGKMCVNVSGDDLMCRYDPLRYEEVSARPGFREMVMKGKTMEGYCYVEPQGFEKNKDFAYWVEICLEFNPRARASKKK